MALQYLQLNQPEYVPKYASISPTLANQSAQSIAQQGLISRQRQSDLLDLAAENISDMTGLNQEDQQFVQERFSQTRQNLEDIFTQRGAAGAMPYLDREVRQLTNDLGYHQQVSQRKSAAIERINNNEEAPSDLKQMALQEIQSTGVEYDEEGNPVGIQGGYDEADLNTIATWSDWTSDVQQFVSNMSPQEWETTYQVDPNETMMYRQRFRELGMKDISAGAMGFLLNHPKYSQQLDLMGRTEIGRTIKLFEERNNRRIETGQEPLELPYKMKDNGEVVASLTSYVLDSDGNKIKTGEDEFGSPIYKTQATNKTFRSPAEMMAAQVASGYESQAIYETTLVGGREVGNNLQDLAGRFNGLRGFTIPSTEPENYLTNTLDRAKQMDDQFKAIQERIGDVASNVLGDTAITSVDNETGEITIEKDGTAYSLNSLIEQSEEGSAEYDNYVKLRDYERSARQSIRESKSLQRELDRFEEGIINSLASNFPELEEAITAMSLTDEGQLQIDGSFEDGFEIMEKFGTQAKDHKMGVVSGGEFDNELNIDRINNIKPGTTNLITLKSRQHQPSSVTYAGVGQPEPVVTDEMVFVGKDNEGNVKITKVDDVFRDTIDRIMQERTDAITGAGTKQIASMVLDEREDVDKAILNVLKRNTALIGQEGQGTLIDVDGNEVTASIEQGDMLDPSEIFMAPDGSPTVYGTLRGPDGENPRGVYWRGEVVEDMLGQALGSEGWQTIATQRAMDSLLPRMYEGEETVSLGPQELASIGALSSRGETFEDVTIRTKRRRRNGTAVDDIYVTIKGVNDDRPIIVNSSDELQRKLWEKTAQHLDN